MPNQRSSEIKSHWKRVRLLGCIVTGNMDSVTLHHPRGGSIYERIGTRGAGKKTSDWLVIPLCSQLHILSNWGIDGGKMSVEEWEKAFGRQVEMVDEVGRRLGLNLWEKR